MGSGHKKVLTDLDEVATAWAGLAEHTRGAILAIVRAVTDQERR